MTELSARAMADRLTEPFAPGADSLSLDLRATGDPATAAVPSYAFDEHRSRFEHVADPTYVLVARRDVTTAATVTVEFGTPSGSTSIAVPAGTLAGTSFALSGIPRGPDVRLLRVRSAPAAGAIVDTWRIVALLGNSARLLWVVGWERDQIRLHVARVVAQRSLRLAEGRSLDYLGSDLGVPRFPPLPYSFDADTLALYHLDDQPAAGQPEVDVAEDVVARYAPPGNPGTNTGRLAQSRAPGRFGSAFAFRDPSAEIRVPSLSGMPLGASDSFTVEAFVKQDLGAADGQVVAKHPNPADPSQPGWALGIGVFGRGVPANVRFLVSDGAHPSVLLFADRSATPDRFHHLAGVVDRLAGVARLYLDGDLVASQPIADLGGMATGEPVRIGRAGSSPFRGLVDEVRLSRTARQSFHPVLGEADASYRKRLGIFRRWTLPTPDSLERALAEVVGPIGGEAQPLVVDDQDSTLVAGELAVGIYPVELAPGESIAAGGDRKAKEADVCGTAAGESEFDPIFLQTAVDPRLTFASAPARILQKGEAPPDPTRMQLVTLRQLGSLLDLLGAQTGLRVESAFDPRASDLRAVGRAVLLTHPGVTQGRLAALANRAGFDFVQRRADLGAIYAASAPGEYLDVVVRAGGTAVPANGSDLFPGQTLVLGVQPSLPPDTVYRWTTIHCGPAKGGFLVTSGGTTSLQSTATAATATLHTSSPGLLPVKVEVERGRRRATGGRGLQVGLDRLPDGSSIAADGTLGAAESVAGTIGPDDFFSPAYLVTHDSPRADYGSDLARRRMQPAVAAKLDRLLGFLSGSPGNLQVLQAFVAGAGDLTGVGRGLTLSHPSISPDLLGGFAHAAGFSFVRRAGNQVVVRESADGLMSVAGPTALEEGSSAALSVIPQAGPRGIAVRSATAAVASFGTDTLSVVDLATGRVSRAVKVGWGPSAVALQPNGPRAYTADQRSNTVTVVDTSTGAVVATVPTPRGPVALAHHPTQARLFVACREDNAVVAIDTGTNAVVGQVAVAARPVGLAIRPDGAEVWVALDTSSRVAVLTTSPFAQAATIALPAQPADVVIRPDGQQAYVTLPAAGQVVLVTVASRTAGAPRQAGRAPTAVAVAPDGSAVFVTDVSGGSQPTPRLLVLDPSGATRATVSVQSEPVDVAADQGHVYVANHQASSVSVVDVAEAGLADTWSLGSGLGERLGWVLRLNPSGQASLSAAAVPTVSLSAERAGRALARAVYTLDDHSDPYTFAVRLKPSLEAQPSVVVRKDQYDLLMNLLNTLHPAGVEVVTRAIRERVVEVREGQLNAFPDYTYPNFRVRGPALRRQQED